MTDLTTRERGSDSRPWIDDSGILRAILPARPRTPQDIDLFAEEARRLLGGKQAPLILDARAVPAASPQAWVQAITNVTSIASAVAIVVSKTTPPEITIYQAQINSLLVPCRLFDDADTAKDWITSIADGPAAGS
jgi:hypothetical protein